MPDYPPATSLTSRGRVPKWPVGGSKPPATGLEPPAAGPSDDPLARPIPPATGSGTSRGRSGTTQWHIQNLPRPVLEPPAGTSGTSPDRLRNLPLARSGITSVAQVQNLPRLVRNHPLGTSKTSPDRSETSRGPLPNHPLASPEPPARGLEAAPVDLPLSLLRHAKAVTGARAFPQRAPARQAEGQRSDPAP